MNFIIPIISAIILGYLCANYVISEYVSTSVVAYKEVYFLELKDDIDIKNKLTIKEDKEYTYIGMTLSEEEANNIKEIYNKNNIDINIRKKDISNNKFLSELEQYDILLKNSTTKEEIDNVLDSILSSYEEILNNR